MQSELKDRGATLPLSSRSVWAILAGVLANALGLVYIYGAWIYRQIFPQSQDESALLLEGERFGEFPKLATQTKVLAIVSGQPGSVIPSGWQASVQSELFEIKNTIEIGASGEETIELTSLSYGSLPAVESLTMTRSIAGVDKSLQVSQWVSGSDKESLVDFRNRIISLRRNRPQGGSISDYIAWSLAHPGIAKVMVVSKQAGIVSVFPLVATQGDDRIPSEDQRQDLERHLNQEDLAPLGVADVIVGQFTELRIDVQVRNISPNTVDIKENIIEAWRLYLWQRFPRQFADEENTLETVSITEMISLAAAAGVKHIDLTLLLDGESVELVTLQYNQIIRLGDVRWS
nr:baseplate J/gp47 family protein [Entomospira entomophilus]